ncbi:MAG: LEA type 2 family protein [Desulfococcus multivorans]|uniref:LEA type 2 family protein n=1 Tax=Desulfococcus sp. TaxID=2025834 RepID=UPI002A4B8AB0|nr:LEA type 2 family protein [Desulfococcus multivorans]
MHRNSAALLMAALLLAGCQTAFQQLPYQQLLDRPVIAFQGKEQRFISYFEAEPIFRFKVDNPNPKALTVKNMTFNLTILDQKFITGVSDQEILVQPNSSEMVELALPFNFMDVFATAEEFQRTDHARFDLTGQATVGPFFIPYDISGELTIPRVPTVDMEVFDAADPARIRMTLVITNPNPFPTPPGFLEYTTTLGGRILGEKRLTPIGALAARSARRMILPVNTPAARMSGPMNDLMTGSGACVLSGVIRYAVPGRGHRNFPFRTAMEVLPAP